MTISKFIQAKMGSKRGVKLSKAQCLFFKAITPLNKIEFRECQSEHPAD